MEYREKLCIFVFHRRGNFPRIFKIALLIMIASIVVLELPAVAIDSISNNRVSKRLVANLLPIIRTS